MDMTFDPGPPDDWRTLFEAAPLDFYVQHPARRFRIEFAPVFYRGRLDGTARVLIVGQDPSTDEILAQRILVGSAGQLVQGLLRKMGIVQSYVMVNTFLFGVTGQFDTKLRTISHAPEILSYRNALLDRLKATNALEAVLAFGVAAHDAVEHWPGHQGLSVHKLVHPTARTGVTDSWNAELTSLLQTVSPDGGAAVDAAPYASEFGSQDLAPIPRLDLPFGLPTWHGTGGTRSTRGNTRNRITWTAP